MKMITVKQIMALNPFPDYTEECIHELIGDGVTPLQVCDMSLHPEISAEDRVWLLVQYDVLPDNVRNENNCKFAERALQREREAGREPAKESWDAIEAVRKFIKGEIKKDELTAAEAEADWAAADWAARAAEAAADWADWADWAAEAAAEAAADWAARAGVWARDAARADEKLAQLDIIRKSIFELKDSE